MKIAKKCLSLLIAVAACMACACAQPPCEDNPNALPSIGASEEVQPTAVQTAAPFDNEPSISGEIVFESADELREFVSLSEMSDDEFERYMHENDLGYYGIRSKDDIKLIKSRLAAFPFPISRSDEWTLASLIYLPSFNDCRIGFNREDNATCSFGFFFGMDAASKGTDVEFEESLIRDYSSLCLIESSRFVHLRKLYAVEDKTEYSNSPYLPEDMLVFYANIDGAWASILTRRLSREEAEKAICSFDFVKLSDIIGK